MLEDKGDGDGGFKAAHRRPGLGEGAGRYAEGRAGDLGSVDEFVGGVHGAEAAVVADRRERLDDETDRKRPMTSPRFQARNALAQRLRGPAPLP